MAQDQQAFSDFLMSVEESSFIATSNSTSQDNSRNVNPINMGMFNNKFTNAPQQAALVSSTYALAMKPNNEAINLTSGSSQPPSRPEYYGQVSQVATHNTPFVTHPWSQKEGYQNRQMGAPVYDGQAQTRSPNTGDGPNITHSPCTPNPRQDYPITPPGNGALCGPQHHKTAAIPTFTEYPGEYEFEIYFGERTESAVKSAEYTHSLTLSKLFVKMNVSCPIQFRCQKDPPESSIIRAMPVYIRPEHVTEVVTRCPNHQIQDMNQGLSRHLIRAEQQGAEMATYDTAPDGRESVLVLYRSPDVGAQYSTVLYRFMCLSSCVGGINRRPIATVFTLESPNGAVLGRRCVEVRVCSCPGRDRGQEEKRKRKSTVDGYSVLLPKKKKPTLQLPVAPPQCEGDEFILRVRGREKFLILQKIKEALDLKELISPQQEEEYKRKERVEDALTRQRLMNLAFKQSHDTHPDGSARDPFPS